MNFSGGSAGGAPPPNLIIFPDQGGGVPGRQKSLHISCKSYRSRKTLKNAPTLEIVAVHTDENETSRVEVLDYSGYSD